MQAVTADTLKAVKKLLQLIVLVALIKVAYDIIQNRQAVMSMPDGAPFEPVAAPTQEDGSNDDLTAVVGIGPVYAGKLNELGVMTFAGLAGADTQSLAGDLDVSADMVTDWQSQARELAG